MSKWERKEERKEGRKKEMEDRNEGKRNRRKKIKKGWKEETIELLKNVPFENFLSGQTDNKTPQ